MRKLRFMVGERGLEDLIKVKLFGKDNDDFTEPRQTWCKAVCLPAGRVEAREKIIWR
jgi:hypothetical protein